MAPLRPGRALSEEEAYVVGVLGGNPESVVDAFAWTALGLVCGLSLLVYAAQKLQARRLSVQATGAQTEIDVLKKKVLESINLRAQLATR